MWATSTVANLRWIYPEGKLSRDVDIGHMVNVNNFWCSWGINNIKHLSIPCIESNLNI